MHTYVPDLGLHHAAATIRITGRGLRYGHWFSKAHPWFLAGVCWFGWRAADVMAQSALTAAPVVTVIRDAAGNPVHDPSGHVIQSVASMQPLGLVAGVAATWLFFAASFFTIGGLTLSVIGVGSRPTHRLGRDGRWHPTRGHVSMAQRRRGTYGRVRWKRTGVAKDWKAAKRDERRANKGLDRAAAYSLTRWGRRWAAEDAAGVERTQPSRRVQRLHRRVKPSKKAKRWAADDRKETRAQERIERRQRAAEWTTLQAEIEANQAARAQTLVDGAPRTGHDPGAPAVVEHSTVGEDPQVRAWSERAREIGDGPSTNGSEP